MTAIAIGTECLFVRADHEPVSDGALLIVDDRIAWSGPRADIPPFEGEWVSWRPPFLVPGLIDAHSHYSIQTPGDEPAQVARPDAEIAIRASAFAAQNLASGVVGTRLLGEPRQLDRLFVTASKQDRGIWPELVTAGPGIRPSHGIVSVADAIVDTEDDASLWVDRIAAQDYAWVKLHATPSSLHGNPTESLFSTSILRQLIRLSKEAGLRIAVHCHGGIAADICIEEGVDTIEHGRFLTGEHLAGMATTGISLVSTVAIGAIAHHRRTGAPLTELIEELATSIARANAAGVNVIPGTDAVHGGIYLELLALSMAGMRPQQIFEQATLMASNVCGLTALGSLEVGKAARAIGLSLDPRLSVASWQFPIGVILDQHLILPVGLPRTSHLDTAK